MDPQNSNRTLSIIMVSLAVLFLIFLGWMIWKSRPVEEADSLVMARETLGWLNERRDERGVYTHGQTCYVEEDSCLMESPIHREGFSAIWARFQYYKTTGDERQRELLRQDLAKYTDRNIVLEIQNYFWNCLFMRDIATSDILNSEEKENARNICLDSIYEVAILISEEMTFDDIEEDTLNEIRNFLRGEALDETESDVKIIYYAADQAARFDLTNDRENLAFAHIGLLDALRYIAQQEEPRDYETCATGIASIEIHNATGREIYLDLAERLAGTLNIREHEKETGAICALFMDKILNAGGAEDHAVIRDVILDNLTSTFYDNSRWSTVSVRQEGGFFAFRADGRYFEKDVRHNGILAGILAKISQ